MPGAVLVETYWDGDPGGLIPGDKRPRMRYAAAVKQRFTIVSAMLTCRSDV